jgi:hypothetical protein
MERRHRKRKEAASAATALLCHVAKSLPWIAAAVGGALAIAFGIVVLMGGRMQLQ